MISILISILYLLSQNKSTEEHNLFRLLRNLLPVVIFAGDVIFKFHIREGYKASVVLYKKTFEKSSSVNEISVPR